MNIILWVENKILEEGIKNILQKNPSFKVVDTGNSKGNFPEAEVPNLLIVSSRSVLSDINTVINGLKQKYNTLNILLFCDNNIEKKILDLHKAGVTGFIPGDCDFDDLLYAVQKTIKGNFYIHPTIAYTLLINATQNFSLNRIEPESLNISQRELEVLQLLTEGYTSNEIADKLFTSRRTVESHRRNLMEKTKSKNTAELIKFSICNQLINLMSDSRVPSPSF